MCKCTSFCYAVFSNKKSSFSFLFICPPGLPSPPLRTICGAGSYMLRWRPPGSLWPFVTCLRGFLQLVKTFRSASLHLTVLNSVSSAAQINDLTSPQNVSQCKKKPTGNLSSSFFFSPNFPCNDGWISCANLLNLTEANSVSFGSIFDGFLTRKQKSLISNLSYNLIYRPDMFEKCWCQNDSTFLKIMCSKCIYGLFGRDRYSIHIGRLETAVWCQYQSVYSDC